MTDFDTELRQRLQRLEAAVPPVAPPTATVKSARPRLRRRRQAIALLAATLALLGGTALWATAGPDPVQEAQQLTADQADEIRLRDDLGAAIGGRCLTKDEALALFRERLHVLGLDDWTITGEDRAREAPCVGAAAAGDSHQIWVMPSMGGELATALDLLAADLIKRCLDKDEATVLMRTTLTDHGLPEAPIEVGGIQIVPVDAAEAYAQHVADGCVVYGGAQFDEVGRYRFYLSDRP